jgi:hypothetical protein
VLVDGKAIVSCQQSLAKTEGKAVTTLEGVAADERAAFANAFAACGGLQCGFCIPGIVMRAKAQIDKKGADLQPADMARHLGRICAGAPVTSRSWKRSTPSPRASSSSQRWRPPSAARAPSTKPANWRWAIAITSTTCACPARCTPPCT